MNFKRKKPSNKKYRYLRRGWYGESENHRRRFQLSEFEKEKYILIKFQNGG